MTSEQYKLYTGILHLFSLFGTGGATWRRTRASGDGVNADRTLTQVGGITIRFCQNNRVAQANTLPNIPIFTAPWWGVAEGSVDIQPEDVYDNGEVAFSITGMPDSSQGFLVPPAASVAVPRSLVLQSGAGFQAGLRIGAW